MTQNIKEEIEVEKEFFKRECLEDIGISLIMIITIPIWMLAFIFLILSILLLSIMDLISRGGDTRYEAFSFLKPNKYK